MTAAHRSDGWRAAVLDRRYRILAGAVALLAGLVVFWLATDLFRYHSANHDEGVYLQQAAMLLEGRLWLTPGSEPLREAFHPWFFVESERGLYPKYAPVPAAMFALGEVVGGYRLTLFAVAVANVALVYALAAAAFDRRTGVLAAATTAAAPTFLLTSSVFLPYAPTTMLNLTFGLAYVRSVRRESHPYAALAGVAVGLAFFARPYTAVLFATPFVLHAAWQTLRTLSAHSGDDPVDLAPLVRPGLTAALGLAFVGLALAYNAVVTGSPLVFPYEAFAPLDGLGFGHRRILGHEVVYTPELALRANARVLWTLATDWFTAGLLGTALAVAGAAAVAVGTWRDGLDDSDPLGKRRLQVLFLGVVVTVVAGNVYFWGNYNLLGALDVQGDGLVSFFGPFYHFDLLLPLSAFAAHAAVSGVDRLRAFAADRATARTARVATLVVLAVSLPVVGAAEANVLEPPVEDNAAYADKFSRAYEPFRETDTTDALVFLPPEYGEWRNHPFQWLRNDPGFDGPTVYALSRGPDADFAVLDAYPDRTYYRYRYHGAWTPDPHDHVVPVLERIRLREGSTLRARTEVTVPDRIVRASVSVSNGETIHRYDFEGDPPDRLAVNWTVTREGVVVEDPDFVPASGRDRDPVPIRGADEIAIAVTITEPGGGSLTYREEVTVRTTDDGVQAVWPPETSVCTLVTECGLEGTYVPDAPGTRPGGIATNTTLVGERPSPSTVATTHADENA